MLRTHEPRDVLSRLTRWAERTESIRAALLTSSRANPRASVDVFSDYDVVLVVSDVRAFASDRSWLSVFGQVLVAYWDPLAPDPVHGVEQTGNVVYFLDGLHIDFRLWPAALARAIAGSPKLPDGLDVGYQVLVDKDGLFKALPPATYQAFVPARPSEASYRTWIEEFFSDVPYVAKCLWRDELLPARWCLEVDMRHKYLVQMLQWRAQCDHGWSVPAGNLGRGLKRLLPAGLWKELEGTFGGPGLSESWDALFKTVALFGRVSTEVGASLGYAYPAELQARVTRYVEEMKQLPLSKQPAR